MKKIIILTAISLFAATSAFAGTDTIAKPDFTSTGLSVWASTTATAASGTNLIGKTSTGVGVQMQTAPSGYALATQHKNGTKTYGSSFDSTSIYSNPAVAGTFPTITLGTSSAAMVTAGWTTM